MNELVITRSGSKIWMVGRLWHRATGPAFCSVSGYCEWYWYGYEVTEFEHMMLAVPETVNG